MIRRQSKTARIRSFLRVKENPLEDFVKLIVGGRMLYLLVVFVLVFELMGAPEVGEQRA